MKTDKIYKIIGQVVVYAGIWALSVAGFIWACTRTVIY